MVRSFLKTNNKHGFTLIELLITIAVIGILISVTTVAYTTIQKKIRDTRRKGDLKGVQKAMEQYYTEHSNAYPSSLSILASTSAYLPNGEPTDPKTHEKYKWAEPPAGASYRVCADMENDGVFDGLSTTTHEDFCVISLQ